MYDLVIFDCDGVLIDSEILSCDALIEALAKFDIRIDRDYVFRHCIGHSLPTVSKKIGALSGFALPTDFETAYGTVLLDKFQRDLKSFPGVIDMLAGLRTPYCIATSSSRERAERSLAAAGLSSLIAPIFTASMVRRGKPAPDLFYLAAGTMGVSPDRCLVIEDSLPGIAAARAAGMAVWRFTGGSHFRLGFGRDDPQLADGSFETWEGFPAFIKRPVPERTDSL